jgi:hypothetical protein
VSNEPDRVECATGLVSCVVNRVSISDLVPGPPLRHGGVDDDYVRLLAQEWALEAPILVHWPTLQVVDGMYRLRAAQLRGERHIKARFVRGRGVDIFVAAVTANVRHGRGLNLDERKEAGRRIILTHPDWSDGMVSSVCLVSPKTVAALRARPTRSIPELDARIGRDGKLRPTDPTIGRRRAAELLKLQPQMTLRAVAREAGISPTTAADVRALLRAGGDPVRCRKKVPVTNSSPRSSSRFEIPSLKSIDDRVTIEDREVTPVQILNADWSFRADEEGRQFLMWLEKKLVDEVSLEPFVNCVPLGRVYVVADIARSCEAAWAVFAGQLEERARQSARSASKVAG